MVRAFEKSECVVSLLPTVISGAHRRSLLLSVIAMPSEAAFSSRYNVVYIYRIVQFSHASSQMS